MKIKQIYLIVVLIAFVLTACSNQKQQKDIDLKEKTLNNSSIDSTEDEQIQKTIKLDHGFEIRVGGKEDYEKFETYTLFILLHHGKPLYRDNSLTEYEFGDKLYPMIRVIDKETFEIFVEVNDRPNKNYLKYFKVHQDKIVATEKMPTFISKASNLDGDSNLELAGFWDFGETSGENNSSMTYDPILYYELRTNGMTLDSTLTIAKNKEIYGDFYGFKYNEKVEINVDKISKREVEIDRIEKAK